MKHKKTCACIMMALGAVVLFINRIQIITLVRQIVDSIGKMIGLIRKQVDEMLFWVIMICVCAIIGILICILMAKLIDAKERRKNIIKGAMSEKHPNLNAIIGLLLVVIIGAAAWGAVYYIFNYLGVIINKMVEWSTSMVSKMDVVVIVAFITGAVSIIGVIISSVIAKIIDYKKNRKEYLTQKREEPYGEFVEMVYKIQQNAKNSNSYTEEMMINDLARFSKKITLWGSTKVVKKWIKFREEGAKPDAGIDNLFILEDIMNEMRRDLGLRRVKKGNLLAFFVNDIKSVMKNKK